jgi:hypothetical protein
MICSFYSIILLINKRNEIFENLNGINEIVRFGLFLNNHNRIEKI